MNQNSNLVNKINIDEKTHERKITKEKLLQYVDAYKVMNKIKLNEGTK